MADIVRSVLMRERAEVESQLGLWTSSTREEDSHDAP